MAALICFLLIVTIPFGFASARIALYALWPFGRTIVDKPGPRPGALVGNVIWICCSAASGWRSVTSLTAIAMAITIIGIPLALANLKLIPVSLMPLGKEIVPVDAPLARAGDDDHHAGPAGDPRRPDAGDAGMPTDGPLLDTYGRVATDLRVSLTDRCNLRCTYCMPAEGLDWLPGDDLLSPDELSRACCGLAVTRLGITSVRFTGGEPLLYRGLEDVIAATAALRPRPEIALTTNGVGLAAAGRTRWPRPGSTGSTSHWTPWTRERFAAITRRDRLDDVLDGLAAAAAAGLGSGEGQRGPRPGRRRRRRRRAAAVLPAVRIPAADHRADAAGRRPPVAARRRRVTRRRHRRRPAPATSSCAPIRRRAARRRPGCGGSTAARTPSASSPRCRDAFCSACDRTRLTADGQVRNCLFATEETDLRALLRSGADDAALETAWRAAMWRKAAGHGINDPDFVQPQRPMSAIGG